MPRLRGVSLAERCKTYVPFYQDVESWIERTEISCGENPIPLNSIAGQSLRGALALLQETIPRIQKLIEQIEQTEGNVNAE